MVHVSCLLGFDTEYLEDLELLFTYSLYSLVYIFNHAHFLKLVNTQQPHFTSYPPGLKGISFFIVAIAKSRLRSVKTGFYIVLDLKKKLAIYILVLYQILQVVFF